MCLTNVIVTFGIAGCDRNTLPAETSDNPRISSLETRRREIRTENDRNSIPASDLRPGPNDAQYRTILSVALQDFDKGAELLRNTVSQEEYDRLIRELAMEVCKADLSKYQQIITHFGNPEDRRLIADGSVFTWKSKDPARLVQFAEQSLTGEMKSYAFSQVIREYSKRNDFKAASRLLDRMPFSQDRSLEIVSLATKWGGFAFESAIEWANSLQASEDRISALTLLVGPLGSANDINFLEKIATASNDRAVRTAALARIGILRADGQGLSTTENWIKTLPKPEQDPVTRALVSQIAQADVDSATRLALRLNDEKERRRALVEILQANFARKPLAMASWAIAVTDESKRETLIQTTVNLWYNIDSIKLSEWVGSLQTGFNRDVALYELASRVAATDPQSARAFAGQIQDQIRRDLFFKLYKM